MYEGLKPGVEKYFQKIVTEEDTALNFGSGAHKHLLATPSLVAFMIESTISMVDPLLPKGFVTVGKSLNVIHEAPTAIGVTVTIKAKLTKVFGNLLEFQITGLDELGVIATGSHERYIVNYDKFMDKVEERCHILTDVPLRTLE
jgi:predicted thioesterase